MRTNAAAGHRGYVHEALCYGSEEEFLGVVVPFLEEGVQAGEPTVVTLGEANAALVRAVMPDSPARRASSLLSLEDEPLLTSSGTDQIDAPGKRVELCYELVASLQMCSKSPFAQEPSWVTRIIDLRRDLLYRQSVLVGQERRPIEYDVGKSSFEYFVHQSIRLLEVSK